MRVSLVFAALLCFTTWMSTVRATNGWVASCCFHWSNTLQRVPLENIVKYTLQFDDICPITAVVFETKHGKRICSDPNSVRAKKAILKVDKDKEAKELPNKPQTEARSTTTIAPAVSSTSKNLCERKNGASIRSNPDNESVTKAMQEVNKEEETTALPDKPQTEARSTTTIAPAVSSTSKNLFETKNGTSIRSDSDNESATKAMQEVDKEEETTALPERPQTEVRFETKNGTSVCSDPDSKGATKAMQEVDKEEEKTALQDKPQTEARSVSTIVPAVSSASKNTPQTTRSYRRRRQRKRSKKLKNWQRRLM